MAITVESAFFRAGSAYTTWQSHPERGYHDLSSENLSEALFVISLKA
ncbi:hypothetical protein Megvenef_01081 [Candidatus Megaera venefica]|uniref:Uncharacterized protein n=1 Tax=Candidatus Megaera venefica TaxID=2055910 RepID=A0ABU5ND73_9RICK|nr:hypothetical protein [Candidatus Megaera venefica]MEA0971108.1 hypothetical protein [Candidatus Megaera venefica]